MYIEIDFGRGCVRSQLWAYLDFTNGSYNKSDEQTVNIPIKLNRPDTNPVSLRLTVTGGKESSAEDHGTGANFTGSGTWVNGGYEENYTTLSFAPGEISKTVTLTIMDNPVLELDRTLTLQLSHAVNCSVLGSGATRTLTIIDDNRVALVNVVEEGIDNTGATDVTAALQVLINAAGYDGKNVFYFPNGEYMVEEIS